MTDQPLSPFGPSRTAGPGTTPDAPGEIGIEDLERWSAFGATWRLTSIESGRATIDMCHCTGELEERRWSEDPAVLDYLRRTPSSG